jgi:hypothetical protein
MLYPLVIETIAADRVAEARHRAAHARLVREVRARTRAELRRARADHESRRYPWPVTLRAAGPATRSPR